MEAALIKLARQLNSYDEASLMTLWRRYMNKVARFEPSRRWEDDALVLCLIQALHWKNQLYNAEIAAGIHRGQGKDTLDNLSPELQPFYMESNSEDPAGQPKRSGKSCAFMLFQND